MTKLTLLVFVISIIATGFLQEVSNSLSDPPPISDNSGTTKQLWLQQLGLRRGNGKPCPRRSNSDGPWVPSYSSRIVRPLYEPAVLQPQALKNEDYRRSQSNSRSTNDQPLTSNGAGQTESSSQKNDDDCVDQHDSVHHQNQKMSDLSSDSVDTKTDVNVLDECLKQTQNNDVALRRGSSRRSMSDTDSNNNDSNNHYPVLDALRKDSSGILSSDPDPNNNENNNYPILDALSRESSRTSSSDPNQNNNDDNHYQNLNGLRKQSPRISSSDSNQNNNDDNNFNVLRRESSRRSMSDPDPNLNDDNNYLRDDSETDKLLANNDDLNENGGRRRQLKSRTRVQDTKQQVLTEPVQNTGLTGSNIQQAENILRICYACSTATNPTCWEPDKRTTIKYCKQEHSCVTKTFGVKNQVTLIRDCANTCADTSVPGIEPKYNTCKICHTDYCNSAMGVAINIYCLAVISIISIIKCTY